MAVTLQLDGQGPRHAQLTRALKQALSDGCFGARGRLPPTRQLARDLGLSRNTVLAAYEQLRAEGLVQARVGSGTRAAVPRAALAERRPVPFTSRPQSATARRARSVLDPEAPAPGRTLPGTRYPFQYGLPLVDPALTSAWARELARAAAYTSPNYPGTQGLPRLREAICDYLARRRGVVATPADILVVAGTQQAVSLAATVLLDPGDLVAIEDPQYATLRKQLLVHGARLHGVPVDEDGLRCDALPTTPPKLVCVTPSHQFPSGALLSMARRQALLAHARAHGSWILEDDYDGEFRYDNTFVPALRSLDRDGRVLYVGTFSKTLFPSLRLGYLVMPPSLRRDLLAAKWAQDYGSSAIEQAALAAFMESGAFERHLRRSTRTLRDRRLVLLHGLRAMAGGRIEVRDSRAGMHLVAWIRGLDAAATPRLVERGASLGLGLHAVDPHYLQPPDRCGLLMGYCGLSTAQLREALPLLERCLREAG